MSYLKKYEETFNISVDVMLTISTKFDNYKRRAKLKNIKFEIPFLAFDQIIKQPCYYCGYKKDLNVLGIDRIDNTKGYISGNCLPSCWDCNKVKSNKTMKEHIEYLKRFNPNLKLTEAPFTLHWEVRRK